MKVVPVVEAKARLSTFLEHCEKEAIVITKNGRAMALLIPAPEDEEELERLVLAYSPRLWHLLEEAARRIRKTGGLSHDEFWSKVASAKRTSNSGVTGRAEKRKVKRRPS